MKSTVMICTGTDIKLKRKRKLKAARTGNVRYFAWSKFHGV